VDQKKFSTVVKDAIRTVLLILCMDVAMNRDESHCRKSEMMAVFCVMCQKSVSFSCFVFGFFLLASQTIYFNLFLVKGFEMHKVTI
jgi:hypothetical protein